MQWERPLDLLEAAYRLDGSIEDWVGGLVHAATNVFQHEGLGSGGFLLHGRVDRQGRTTIADISSPWIESQAIRYKSAPQLLVFSSLPAEVQHSLWFSSTQMRTLSDSPWVGSDLPTWIERSGLDSSMAGDALGLSCQDGTKDVLFIGAGLRQKTSLTEQDRRLGERIATHIGAALRLRRRPGVGLNEAEVVLSRSGKVQHLASASAGGRIAEGFARRRHARSGRVGAEAALEVWQGLHDGRWSLVDYVDTDGKAFVLAVRNEPARDVASALTDRQRAAVALAALGYANKQIAYALGLTATAVAMLLARARAATAVRTRAELVRAFKRSLSEGA
jgi:DNA-binding CsgD family transcriptional regulator